MAGVLTVQGEQIVLEALVNKTAPQSLALLLYTNAVTPARATVAGDLTEAAGSGYARAALPAASWTFTAGASPPGRLAHPLVTFTFTAALGAPVYGYGLIQTTSGILVAAERFPAGPYPITVAGEAITITVTLEIQ